MALMALTLFCLLTWLTPSYAKTLQPNIIWIMADDLGWGEPENYPSTSPHGRISTPNLVKFGNSGIQFTNAYAGYTVCAPSRTTLMTGYHSGHFVREGLSGTNIPVKQKILTTQEMLQKAGYATAGVGKMAPLSSPTQQGFDYFIGQVDQGLCHNMYPRRVDTGNGTQNVNLSLNWAIPSDHEAARKACMANPDHFNYTVDITHQHSMAWVEQHVQKQRTMQTPRVPFYLYEAFTVPHAGGWGHAPQRPESGAPVPSNGQYVNQTGWPEVERDHAAVITYLDNYVGQLMSLLERLDIANETIVFFASDNGAHLEGGHDYHFFNSTGGLLGHKRSLYEGGVRSPTMVRWPGTIKAGVVSDFVWAFWDFMPTVAELSGGKAPGDIDGVSIVPTLMGKAQPPKPYVLFTWHGEKGANPAAPAPVKPHKPHPVLPSSLAGLWCQGATEHEKCEVPISIGVTLDKNYTVTLIPCPYGSNCTRHHLNWQRATGTLTVVDNKAIGLQIKATGKNNFTTDEKGIVGLSGSSVTIFWEPDGGKKRHWGNWKHDSNPWDPRLPAPLPAGWTSVQLPNGRLGFMEEATGRTNPATRPKTVGYGVRVGEWKGVVGLCKQSEPSDEDVYEIYNLATDPFEQKNLAGTPQGEKQITTLRSAVKAAGIKCACFQC